MKFLRYIGCLGLFFVLQSFSYPSVNVASVADKFESASEFSSQITMEYDSLHLQQSGLSLKAFAAGLQAMQKISSSLKNPDIITIADFSQSSNAKRLYVIDLRCQEILFQTYVAHGQNSGGEFATSFSNKSGCHKSSLGCFVTLDPYQGENGLSLRIEGMDRGINDRAFDRAVVIHGADYVSEKFIHDNNRLGRSYGCPAIPVELTSSIINTIKGGSCIFIYHPAYRGQHPVKKS
jgi:hypothetical protein